MILSEDPQNDSLNFETLPSFVVPSAYQLTVNNDMRANSLDTSRIIPCLDCRLPET
jgi:hypothetical protein